MKRIIGLLFALVLLMQNGRAADSSTQNETPEQREARMKWFNEARFGMFIHWGLYSHFGGEWEKDSGGGEWIFLMSNVPTEAYKGRTKEFNPTRFNAKEWVQIAKNAGMKYMVITAKHHDGFCMFDSKLTDFSISKATPFKRDPIAELSAECKKEGIVFCVYYSGIDWTHPDYPAALNPTAPKTKKPFHAIPDNPGNLNAYLEYMKGQLGELLSNYGPIGILWFDGTISGTPKSGQANEILDTVRKLQPNTIVNDRLGIKADYITTEQWVPITGQVREVFESCMTMNHHWGFCKNDLTHWKPVDVLLKNLARCASQGGNYLLNVGPTGEGFIPEASVERLAKVGEWLKVNGEAIYGTSGCPFWYASWGTATTKGKTVYLLVENWPADGVLRVPLANKVKKAWLVSDSSKRLKTVTKGKRIEVAVPIQAPDPYLSVVALQLDGAPIAEPPPMKSITAVRTSSVHKRPGHGPEMIFDGSMETHWWAEDDDRSAWFEFDFARPMNISKIMLRPTHHDLIQKFDFQYKDDDSWKTIFSANRMDAPFDKTFPPVCATTFRVQIHNAAKHVWISEMWLYEHE